MQERLGTIIHEHCNEDGVARVDYETPGTPIAISMEVTKDDNGYTASHTLGAHRIEGYPRQELLVAAHSCYVKMLCVAWNQEER